MSTLQFKSNPKVESKFDDYPDLVKEKMIALRTLIIEVAQATDEITLLEETLKWGEPSFITPIGSTLRIDWKAKDPEQYALYFQCSSRLVSTFRIVFRNDLKFEGNRAIVLPLNGELPKNKLIPCIKAALTYHKVKQLPTLGI